MPRPDIEDQEWLAQRRAANSSTQHTQGSGQCDRQACLACCTLPHCTCALKETPWPPSKRSRRSPRSSAAPIAPPAPASQAQDPESFDLSDLFANPGA